LENFDKFINKDSGVKYRLFVDDESDSDVDWDFVMDFSKIWESYNNTNNVISLVKDYKYKVNEYKDTITEKKGVDIWNELVIILNDFKDFTLENSYKTFDKVYDWGDKNNINIK